MQYYLYKFKFIYKSIYIQYKISIYVNILPVCMYVHYVCFWCHIGQKRGIESPGTGVTDGCKPPLILGIEPWSSIRATSAPNH